MTDDYARRLRSDYSQLTIDETLQQPTSALLGVGDEATDALAKIGIESIFDLGCSWVFTLAERVAIAEQERGQLSKNGGIPSDWLQPDFANESLESLRNLPLEAFRGIAVEHTDSLKRALEVETIGEFAFWPPRCIAAELVSLASGTVSNSVDDPAEVLRPQMGEYPTERVYYDTLTLLHLDQTEPGRPLDAPLSLQPTYAAVGSFKKPAIGALLTFSQSWFAQGVTLGNMLHSLALAPGEATRIAVIDWSRRTSATASETVGESETLDTTAGHSRSISEVQNAVANELQQGGSTTSGWATSSSEARGSASSSGLMGAVWGGGGGSRSSQESITTSGAESASWSIGSRSVLAEMAQTVNDRTEQHSTGVRNRRASAVREVSQAENETVSTRIVANYNHMHALTIQYYEVVQIYQVATALHGIQRCLFVPYEILNFAGSEGIALIERFRQALLAGALSSRARELILDDTTTVNIRATANVRVPSGHLRPGTAPQTSNSSLEAIRRQKGNSESEPTPDVEAGTGSLGALAAAATPELTWDPSAILKMSRLVDRPVLRRGSNDIHLPDDTMLEALSFEGVDVASVRLDRVGQTAADSTLTVPEKLGRVEITPPVPLRELETVHIALRDAGSLNARVKILIFHCSLYGRPITSPLPLALTAGTTMQKVAEFSTDEAGRQQELLTHLQDNREHYSRSIFRNIDAATMVALLAPFTWKGKPLIDQLDPKPVTVAGNYIVFRAPIDMDEPSGVDGIKWGEMLEQRGLGTYTSQGRWVNAAGDNRLIPIPTNGVFAEAVLGRSNSAEKLDITRFWNWQDSPIPLQPPEISPISTGTRATAEDLTPGALSNPVLNIQAPVALPDPAGLSAALQTVANSAMFRDMSGLAGTQASSQNAMQGTLSAAGTAGQLASDNLRIEAEKAVAMGQIAGDLAKAAMGVPPTGQNKTTGISGDGARINHGRDMDERNVDDSLTEDSADDGPPVTSSAIEGASSPTGPSTGSEAGAPAVKPKPKRSREAKYADGGALGYSPGAVADAAKAVSSAARPSKNSKGDTTIDFKGDTITAGKEYSTINANLADTRLDHYLGTVVATITNARQSAYAKFRHWYPAYLRDHDGVNSDGIAKALAVASFNVGLAVLFPEVQGANALFRGFILDAGDKLAEVGLDDAPIDTTVERLLERESRLADSLNTFRLEYRKSPQYRKAIETYIMVLDVSTINTDQTVPEAVLEILKSDGIPVLTTTTYSHYLEETLARLMEPVVARTRDPHEQGQPAIYLAEIEAMATIDLQGNRARICEKEKWLLWKKFCGK
ncbi:hypothetical protein [Pseudarthrobacter sp. NCCP-2145]|uniref:hypothetical protein n=1 Tax=Pseudarthrobacter sp. NCCP-2145 TaxID=2942290 RepID=UPI00203CAE3B|nr:hypothetical protein [Pseudarthrobacter sp. NCCP-2145]GKV74454.1 hypothetical protein NCCP2145_38350 [Pseudarthrobacter sp. NCCP-2145]